jgi:hypothetical protein
MHAVPEVDDNTRLRQRGSRSRRGDGPSLPRTVIDGSTAGPSVTGSAGDEIDQAEVI